MSIVTRILEIIEYKQINKSKFYRETGLSNGFLDKVKDIGATKIENILNTYKDIDSNWLITGKGQMLSSRNKTNLVLNELSTLQLIDHLLEHKDELIQNETFRDYIRKVMELIMADDEREKKNKALEELKEIALKKYRK